MGEEIQDEHLGVVRMKALARASSDGPILIQI